MLKHLEVGIGLRNLRYGLGVARLRLVILALGKVDAAQGELADGLVDAIAGALLGGLDITLHGVHGVASRQVQVAYGVVNLVEVCLVAVVARHGTQGAHLLVNVLALIHGALLDAGVELGAIGGTATAAGTTVGLVSHCLVASVLIELSQEEIQAGALAALGTLHSLAQIGNGLLILRGLDVVVGHGQIGERTHALVLNLVDVHMHQHVVGLGGPPHGAVTQSLPHLCLQHEVGLPHEVARDVAEGGGGVQEVALHVLRLSHGEPRVVDKRVVLGAAQPLLVLGVVALAGLALGFLLDAVQGDGLLHLLDGAVETAAGLRSLGVGARLGGMDEHVLRVVVLVGVKHLGELLVVVRATVVVNVVARGEPLPEPRHGRVVLGATSLQHQQHGHHGQRYEERLSVHRARRYLH